MSPQEWWDKYGKSKYQNFSLDGTSVKPTGSDLHKPQLWKQSHWRWYFANEEDEEFDSFTLGYTNGDGEEVLVVVNDSDEADSAFEEMYASSPLGYDIPYSID